MATANEVSEEAKSRVGRTLCDKWTLDRFLGAGGSAAVYEAHHRNGARVAVKILHHRMTQAPEQVARFRREGRAANRVAHAGVVTVFDEDVDDMGFPFLVMELLEGETLAERATSRGGALPMHEVLDAAEHVLDVLAAAHAKGILHRDIKPQNLFLTRDGALKVLDFGIARVEASDLPAFSTEVGTILGTPAFVPPEQARGRADQMDERSDLWAVGATMFTLLSGRPVHEAGTTIEQLGLAMMVGARSLAMAMPALPPRLISLVDRALAYAPIQRWPNAAAMRDELRALRSALAGSTEPQPTNPVDGSTIDLACPDETLPAFGQPPAPRRSKTVFAGLRRFGPILAASCLALSLVRPAPPRSSVSGAVERTLPVVERLRPVASNPPAPVAAPATTGNASSSPSGPLPERRRAVVRSSPAARISVHAVEQPATATDPTTPVPTPTKPERANGLPVATDW